MNEYKFVRLDDDNLKDLLFLYKHAFNEVTDLSFLQKKYDTTFTGIKHVGFIAYHSSTNEPAAYYGVFPLKLEIGGKILIAAQSGDTMTHPTHRGKGLFIKLATETYALAKNLGIEFIFGFPNSNSYPGFINKLNWKHYSNINHYKLKGSGIPLDKIVKKIPAFSFLHNLVLPKRSLSQKDQFSNSLKLQSTSSGNVFHNTEFFQYKSYYPSFIIELEGVKCWVKIDGRMWIGDIDYCDEKKFNDVVNALIAFAKKKFCSSIVFSVLENSSYDLRLKNLAQPNSSIAVGCLDLSGQYKPENFAYQAGDFDTF